MVLDRTDENAWELHYAPNENGEYEEGQSFLFLSTAEQRIVRNQMHYATRNWAYFYFYSHTQEEIMPTRAERRTGLPDEALMNLLTIATLLTKEMGEERI